MAALQPPLGNSIPIYIFHELFQLPAVGPYGISFTTSTNPPENERPAGWGTRKSAADRRLTAFLNASGYFETQSPGRLAVNPRTTALHALLTMRLLRSLLPPTSETTTTLHIYSMADADSMDQTRELHLEGFFAPVPAALAAASTLRNDATHPPPPAIGPFAPAPAGNFILPQDTPNTTQAAT